MFKLQFLLEHCSLVLQQHGGVLVTLFLAGLVGGLTHCSGMCGPFVATQSVHLRDDKTKTLFKRISGLSLLPYHLGRMTTYTTLGVIASLLSKQIMGSPLERWISVVFLSLAGAIFILTAMPDIKSRIINIRYSGISRFAEILGSITRPFFADPAGFNGYVLGVLLGFLPCGLIFASLMVVSTTGQPLTAALAMVLFTIGTMPSLILVGMGSRFAYRKWPSFVQRTAKVVMAFNGVSLFLMAGRIAV